MKSPIFASWLEDRSGSGFNDVAINCFGEQVGKSIGLLLDRGGLVLLVTVGTGPIRGTYVARDGNLYVVSGGGFYMVTPAYVVTQLGNVASNTGPVSIIDNPTQILVVDGVGGWCWDISAWSSFPS